MTEILYIGHIIGEDAMKVDMEKIRSILEWPHPKSLTELRGLVGICTYYRNFMKGFSQLTSPLIDLKIDHEGICKGCTRGKNIKNPFPKSETKTKGTLELIHSDVCGPMPSTSLSGYAYYVTFIDDYSRKTWIYFLKAKDEVFGKFKEFKALIENHSERRIKTLRTDNGG